MWSLISKKKLKTYLTENLKVDVDILCSPSFYDDGQVVKVKVSLILKII